MWTMTTWKVFFLGGGTHAVWPITQSLFNWPEPGSVIRPPAEVTVDQTRASLSGRLSLGNDAAAWSRDLWEPRPRCLTLLPSVRVCWWSAAGPAVECSGRRRWVLVMLSRAARSESDTLLLGLSEALRSMSCTGLWDMDIIIAVLVRSGPRHISPPVDNIRLDERVVSYRRISTK